MSQDLDLSRVLQRLIESDLAYSAVLEIYRDSGNTLLYNLALDLPRAAYRTLSSEDSKRHLGDTSQQVSYYHQMDSIEIMSESLEDLTQIAFQCMILLQSSQSEATQLCLL